MQPITITSTQLDGFLCCEEGRLEDHERECTRGDACTARDTGQCDGGDHSGGNVEGNVVWYTAGILQSKARVTKRKAVLRTQEQVDELWYALCTGTFAIWYDDFGSSRGARPAAEHIAKQLHAHVSPQSAKRYAWPSGM